MTKRDRDREKWLVCALCHYPSPSSYGKNFARYFVCLECVFSLGEAEVRRRLRIDNRRD